MPISYKQSPFQNVCLSTCTHVISYYLCALFYCSNLVILVTLVCLLVAAVSAASAALLSCRVLCPYYSINRLLMANKMMMMMIMKNRIIKQNWIQFLLVVKQQILKFYRQIPSTNTFINNHIYINQRPVINVYKSQFRLLGLRISG